MASKSWGWKLVGIIGGEGAAIRPRSSLCKRVVWDVWIREDLPSHDFGL